MKISNYLSFGDICHSVDIELDSSDESDVKFAQWVCEAFDVKLDKYDGKMVSGFAQALTLNPIDDGAEISITTTDSQRA